jgi:hypothetical protein
MVPQAATSKEIRPFERRREDTVREKTTGV